MPASASQASAVVTLLASTALTANGSTSNLKDGTGNLPLCDSMSIYVDVTVISGQVTVIVQTSNDNGTTWYDVVQTAQINAVGQRRIDFRNGLALGEVAAEGSISAITTTAVKQNTALTRDVRIRYEFVGSSTATLSVFAICVPMGMRG